MNRFESISTGTLILSDGETVVTKHDAVKIYDGHDKVRK